MVTVAAVDLTAMEHTMDSAAEATARRVARRRKILLRVASVILLVLLWAALSQVIPFKAVVSPWTTVQTIGHELNRGVLLPALGITMLRVAEAFALAMGLGIALGIALGSYGAVDALLSIWVTVAITIPGLIWLVIGYIAFGVRNDTGLLFAVTAMVAPTVLVAIMQGTRAIDRQLVEMARSYGRSTASIVGRVIVPQLLPYIFAAARYGLALSWQMVIFAEIIGRPNGMGVQIYYNYQTSNIPGIWAFGFTFIAVALFFEFGVLANIQRYLFRWRQGEDR